MADGRSLDQDAANGSYAVACIDRLRFQEQLRWCFKHYAAEWSPNSQARSTGALVPSKPSDQSTTVFLTYQTVQYAHRQKVTNSIHVTRCRQSLIERCERVHSGRLLPRTRVSSVRTFANVHLTSISCFLINNSHLSEPYTTAKH